MGANELPLAQAAEFYASHGIPIFPLAPRSKHPLKHSRGFYDATTELEQVRRWWSEHPEANIGVALGEPSGRWLLDADAKPTAGWRRWRRCSTVTPTWTARRGLTPAAAVSTPTSCGRRELTWLRCGASAGRD
jgi:hypothetical protein